MISSKIKAGEVGKARVVAMAMLIAKTGDDGNGNGQWQW